MKFYFYFHKTKIILYSLIVSILNQHTLYNNNKYLKHSFIFSTFAEKNMLNKLLLQNISKTQLLGFAVANLIGLAIVLLAVQLFFDINPLFSQKDTIFKRDFFVITKPVKTINAIKKTSGFGKNEIEELQNARFVKQVGEFTSSQFVTYGGITAQGASFGTDLFFESVPNDFIDVKTEKWTFSPDSNFIPIILPKTYLDLYNFGFAEARSMPKVSQNLAGMVSMEIEILGNGKHEIFIGQVVGFSNRINTILVPENFMQWANNRFADGSKANPARLILEVDNVADEQIATFFRERGYEVEGENAAIGKMSFFLKIIIGIAVSVGLFICLLSFVILVLSIYLILQKNMQKLQNLRLIGYSKNSIARFYILLACGINFVVYLLAFAVVLLVRPYYSKSISRVFVDFEPSGFWSAAVIGFGIFAVLSIMNIFIIRKKCP